MSSELRTEWERVAVVDASALSRFATKAAQLRELLQASDGCDQELLLRSAMRDALRELADVSTIASHLEADALRAGQLRHLSRLATELAQTTPARQ
jgi:hypothetical protein